MSPHLPRPAPPRLVVFDLDGVIRDWNDGDLAEMETSFGLDPGEILAVAFDRDLGPAATTGAMRFREWMDEVRRRILAQHGPSVTRALDEWEANIGHVDVEMLEVLRAVRRRCRAVVLSNGTTRLRRDLQALDLTDEFDEIYNTAEIGIAKPDPAVFHHLLDIERTAAGDALFIDDLAENVAGARTAGLRAHHHTDRASTVAFLEREGVAIS